jgi:hypothetical protein
MKPIAYVFNFSHDSDSGEFCVIIARAEDKDILFLDREIDRIMPLGFFRMGKDENIYGFAMKLGEAREMLKNWALWRI